MGPVVSYANVTKILTEIYNYTEGCRKYYFVDALSSCFEIDMFLYFACIFEPLRETLLFLETLCVLKFCVWHSFYYLHHFVRVQQTPYSYFCFSNVGSLIKLILHEPYKNSVQVRHLRQFAWLMTFYNPAHIRETTKSS